MDEDLRSAPEHYLEGEIEDVLFISVPITTSSHSCTRLREMVQMATKKQVVIITHNIEFLKTEKLSPKEAAKIIKRIEDVLDEPDVVVEAPEA